MPQAASSNSYRWRQVAEHFAIFRGGEGPCLALYFTYRISVWVVYKAMYCRRNVFQALAFKLLEYTSADDLTHLTRKLMIPR